MKLKKHKQRFEHMICHVVKGAKFIEEFLVSYERQGYELVTMFDPPKIDLNITCLIFKRPV